MIGPTNRKNWLTCGCYPFPKTDPDQYSTSLTVAEQEICGDLLALLIQSRPSFTILSEMTDADEMMKSLQHFGSDLADIRNRIRINRKSGFEARVTFG